MSVYYIEYNFPAPHAMPAALAALGDEARNGVVVRVKTTPTETRIVLAYPAGTKAAPAKSKAVHQSRSVTEAEVLEPASCRAEMKRTVEALTSRYQSKPKRKSEP